jgi:hypothetical protein
MGALMVEVVDLARTIHGLDLSLQLDHRLPFQHACDGDLKE